MCDRWMIAEITGKRDLPVPVLHPRERGGAQVLDGGADDDADVVLVKRALR